MLAVQKVEPAPGVVANEVEPPEIAADEVLIEVIAAGICGSDVHVFDWGPAYSWMAKSLPVTIGHEFSGRVSKLGSGVETLQIGDQVSILPDVSCGTCDNCLRDESLPCRKPQGIGMSRHGGFAQYVAVPARNCIVLPEQIDAELAALIEPLSVGAMAVDVGEVEQGTEVVVLGAGMIGLSIAMMARHAGAKVMIVGLNDEERLQCAARLGFEHAYDLAHLTLKEATELAFGGRVDRIFEATGVPESITDAVRVLNRGGIIVATGIHSRPLEIDLTPFVRKRQQLRASYASDRKTWLKVMDILVENGNDFRGLITHRLPLSEALAGFALSKDKVATKVILLPSAA